MLIIIIFLFTGLYKSRLPHCHLPIYKLKGISQFYLLPTVDYITPLPKEYAMKLMTQIHHAMPAAAYNHRKDRWTHCVPLHASKSCEVLS